MASREAFRDNHPSTTRIFASTGLLTDSQLSVSVLKKNIRITGRERNRATRKAREYKKVRIMIDDMKHLSAKRR